MIPASVFIICLNEEKHIKRTLEAIKEFDDIVIVDSGSTDNTLDIARLYTDKIFYKSFSDYASQKEYAKSLCSHEWVLNIDADERLSDELKNEIVKTIQNNDTDALEVSIVSLYMNSFNTLTKPITRIRFFKKSMGFYPQKLVHESIKFSGRVRKTSTLLYDYGSNSITTHINKINNYSSLRAQEKFLKQKRSNTVKLLFIIPLVFFKSYFIRRNFLNGKRGFIAAISNAFYAFLKEAKLYELELQGEQNPPCS
ncbi:glycosyltransferase family 2 protein [Campylobacter suis]|uniref:Glycosyltransferase 2-like domain-containing protein n=1 Tax=Campylobacter suis TaxID=2790657 RepID=A0ABM8Q1V4_9BACT|nr:glycosyltransferase family 2 protein [Campylobacter suis]CAD7286825.1 hypothetical protein LMG8286_00556 [Campylobacter suis]